MTLNDNMPLFTDMTLTSDMPLIDDVSLFIYMTFIAVQFQK